MAGTMTPERGIITSQTPDLTSPAADEATPADGLCEFCGARLPARLPGPGRPRKYCRQVCRQNAYLGRTILDGWTERYFGDRDNWICYLCDDVIDPLVKYGAHRAAFDFVIPFEQGGRLLESNIRLVHWKCEAERLGLARDTEPAEFRALVNRQLDTTDEGMIG